MAFSYGTGWAPHPDNPADQDLDANALLIQDEADELVNEEHHRRHERWKRELLGLFGRGRPA